jgi:hypothetical protein
MIIGLLGRARSGKDTVANCINELYSTYEICRIAQPIKDSLRALYGWSDKHIEGFLKEVTDPIINKSPRDAMIELGERVKSESGQDFFINMLLRKHKGDIIIPDVRFQNEVDRIREAGGIIIKIERPNCSCLPNENGIDQIKTDLSIWNGRSIENLQEHVYGVITFLNIRNKS